MKVILPRKESFVSKNSKIFSIALIVVFILIWIICISEFIYFTIHAKNPAELIIIPVASLLLNGYFIIQNKDLRWIIEEYNAWRKGLIGENSVAKLLGELDDKYTYFQNCKKPTAREGDIDGILLGPHGILLLEIKNWSGTYIIENKTFYKRYSYGKRKCDSQPIQRILDKEGRMKNELKTKSIRSVIVFKDSTIHFLDETGVTILTNESELLQHIKKLPHKKDFNKHRDDLVRALTDLTKE